MINEIRVHTSTGLTSAQDWDVQQGRINPLSVSSSTLHWYWPQPDVSGEGVRSLGAGRHPLPPVFSLLGPTSLPCKGDCDGCCALGCRVSSVLEAFNISFWF